MVQRYKVTIIPSATGNLDNLFIDKTKDINVIRTRITLPAYTSNVVRDVSIERPDGTLLGTQKASYRTSGAIGLIFEGDFILPHYDPLFKINTHTVIVTAIGNITVEMFYEEVKL